MNNFVINLMALAGELRETIHSSFGTFPKVEHKVSFYYSNGLIVGYDGNNWEVLDYPIGYQGVRL